MPEVLLTKPLYFLNNSFIGRGAVGRTSSSAKYWLKLLRVLNACEPNAGHSSRLAHLSVTLF